MVEKIGGEKMLTLLFAICMIWVFGKLFVSFYDALHNNYDTDGFSAGGILERYRGFLYQFLEWLWKSAGNDS